MAYITKVFEDPDLFIFWMDLWHAAYHAQILAAYK